MPILKMHNIKAVIQKRTTNREKPVVITSTFQHWFQVIKKMQQNWFF